MKHVLPFALALLLATTLAAQESKILRLRSTTSCKMDTQTKAGIDDWTPDSSMLFVLDFSEQLLKIVGKSARSLAFTGEEPIPVQNPEYTEKAWAFNAVDDEGKRVALEIFAVRPGYDHDVFFIIRYSNTTYAYTARRIK